MVVFIVLQATLYKIGNYSNADTVKFVRHTMHRSKASYCPQNDWVGRDGPHSFSFLKHAHT